MLSTENICLTRKTLKILELKALVQEKSNTPKPGI